LSIDDIEQIGGAPGGKRSKNPGAPMKKYKTPGEKKRKNPGSKVD